MTNNEAAAVLRQVEREPVHMKLWLERHGTWPQNTRLTLLLAAEHLENCNGPSDH